MFRKYIMCMEDNASPAIKRLRIILLVLIIIGIGLLATQALWVPKVVDFLMRF